MSPTTNRPVDVLCVGNSSVDYVSVVERFPNINEKVAALSFDRHFGGPAATAAVTVAKLGGRAAFAGHCGDDEDGARMRNALQSDGVDCFGLIVNGAAQTRASLILVDRQTGKRTVANYSHNKLALPPSPNLISRFTPKVMLFDGFEPEMAMAFFEKAGNFNAATVLDAGSVRQGARALAAKVDYLIAAEKFALDFTGETNLEAALDSLYEENGRFAAVTLGEKGCLAKFEGQVLRLPAFSVNAADTTGAGDVFHGAFCWALLKDMSHKNRLQFASAAAALSCEGVGGRGAIPNLERTLQFVRSQCSDFPRRLN